jgi:light-regulated signal transduction histidine kinase (bacteriophytochrome)
VRGNRAGFDMAYAQKLFQSCQRMHEPGRFAGTGICLAIVQRIIDRHGSRVWVESAPGEGASSLFTPPP